VKIDEKKSAEALKREERRLLREEQKNEMTLRAHEKLKQEEIALEHAKLDQVEKLKIMELD